VLTFDTLSTGPIPYGYGGLAWANASAAVVKSNRDPLYAGIISGSSVAVMENSTLTSVSRQAFTINSVFLTTGEATTIALAWNDTYTSGTLPADSTLYLNFGDLLSNVTSVTILADRPVILDDLNVTFQSQPLLPCACALGWTGSHCDVAPSPPPPPAVPVCSTLSIDFETGQFETENVSISYEGYGTWFVYNGTSSPLSHIDIPAPFGEYAVVSDESFKSAMTLFITDVVGSGQVLTFDYFIKNTFVNGSSSSYILADSDNYVEVTSSSFLGKAQPRFIDFPSMSIMEQPNQQALVYIMPTGFVDAPDLLNVYPSGPYYPIFVAGGNTDGYVHFSYPLDEFAGMNITVVFATVVTLSVFLFGIDNIAISGPCGQVSTFVDCSVNVSTPAFSYNYSQYYKNGTDGSITGETPHSSESASFTAFTESSSTWFNNLMYETSSGDQYPYEELVHMTSQRFVASINSMDVNDGWTVRCAVTSNWTIGYTWLQNTNALFSATNSTGQCTFDNCPAFADETFVVTNAGWEGDWLVNFSVVTNRTLVGTVTLPNGTQIEPFPEYAINGFPTTKERSCAHSVCPTQPVTPKTRQPCFRRWCSSAASLRMPPSSGTLTACSPPRRLARSASGTASSATTRATRRSARALCTTSPTSTTCPSTTSRSPPRRLRGCGRRTPRRITTYPWMARWPPWASSCRARTSRSSTTARRPRASSCASQPQNGVGPTTSTSAAEARPSSTASCSSTLPRL